VEAANLIKFGINRKITKRQVMVVPYAGTFSSCMEYTREAVLEKIKEGHPCPWDSSDTEVHTKHMVLLSKLIWEAIDEVVVKGKEAMRWLSQAAQEYTKWANKNLSGPAHTKCMHWFTPDGFEVIHYRVDHKKKQIQTYLDGKTRSMQINVDTDHLSSKDMALAVAPNFVHSMDACLLRASIMKGLDKGITSFGMVHDSFGVHATRMTEFLNSCVKPAFVDMYQRDVLEDFRSKLPPDLDLPSLPTKGQLVLEDVKDSEFFFS
jgi:DNA-directed RNA polymerase